MLGIFNRFFLQMKLILLFFLSFLIFRIDGNGQIIIEGKIHNYDGESKVIYVPTLEGIHSSSLWETVQPNSKGEFKIKYKNNGYGTTRVGFKRLYYRFFHDDNTRIYFEIDQNKINIPQHIKGMSAIKDSIKETSAIRERVMDSIKYESTISINGDFQDVNNYYNTNIRSSYFMWREVGGNYYSHLIRKAEQPSEVLQIIDSLIEIETKQISALGNLVNQESAGLKKANNEIKQFLKNEVRSFYSVIFLSGMFLKRTDQQRELFRNPDTTLTIYNRQWEKLIEYFFAELSESVTPSANSAESNELVLSIKSAMASYKNYHNRPKVKSFDEYIVEGTLRPDSTLLDSILILDSKSALAYKAYNLWGYLHSQTAYSPTLLNAYNELKNQYPNSIHITRLEPQVEKLKVYLKSSSEKFDKAEFINTNYYQFVDLLELFRGKNILIDVWATWCGPCIHEFNYKDTFRPFIDSGELTVLYISIDKERWEQKWRDNIKYNQLEGYHVLANNVLKKDMWDFLGGLTGAIPRYALINKKGEIFINEAARPSQKELLRTQIDDLVSFSKE